MLPKRLRTRYKQLIAKTIVESVVASLHGCKIRRLPLIHLGLMLLMGLLASCALHKGRLVSVSPVLASGKAMTWQAEMSCPGCSERWLTLTLFPDGIFRTRERYLNASLKNDESFYDMGSWSVALSDSTLVTLRGSQPSPQQYRLLKNGKLRLLDRNGREVRSLRDYTMPRLATVDWIVGPMRILGLYQSGPNGSVFTECLTGQNWSLTAGMGANELARQYAQMSPAQRESGPVMVSLSGQFLATSEESHRLHNMSINSVDRFWPGEICSRGPIAPARPLVDTRWLLRDIAGLQTKDDIMAMPAHFRLYADLHLAGSTGCNRMHANFSSQATELHFTHLVTTRISCAAVQNEAEMALLRVLQETQQYRIASNELSLLNGSKVLARFVATEMP